MTNDIPLAEKMHKKVDLGDVLQFLPERHGIEI